MELQCQKGDICFSFLVFFLLCWTGLILRIMGMSESHQEPPPDPRVSSQRGCTQTKSHLGISNPFISPEVTKSHQF